MYLKYLKYVIRHKWFVFLECRKLKRTWLGIIHDWSKFRPSEFIPYARYFYGNYPKYNEMAGDCRNRIKLYKEDIDNRFDKAWLCHIHRNKHHWQYWLLQEDEGGQKNIPIPIKYLNEMVADWHGAGRAITGKNNTLVWYERNKAVIRLNRINRKWVEKKLQEANTPQPDN